MSDHHEGVSRRAALGALGAAALAAPHALTAGIVETTRPAHVGTGFWPDCVVTPAQMEGPYFVDEKLERVDIRSDPTDGTVSTGLPLRLRMGVHRVDGTACAPITGAHVDVWQCDAAGIYAGVVDTQGLFDTRAKKFLRGYQVSNARGVVEFQTIYPGWYPGRTPHIHFKVRLYAGAQKSFEFTSQLYFDDAITDRIYAQAPYNTKGDRSTRNNRDGIFQRENGPQLLFRLSEARGEWTGEFDIGLRLTS